VYDCEQGNLGCGPAPCQRAESAGSGLNFEGPPIKLRINCRRRANVLFAPLADVSRSGHSFVVLETAKQLIKEAYDARQAGDIAASLLLYTRAATTGANDPVIRAHCLRHIGDLERQAGRVTEAQAALRDAEALYRTVVSDPLSLANTIRLRALTDGTPDLWKEARSLYAKAETETGMDLSAAFKECNTHLGR